MDNRLLDFFKVMNNEYRIQIAGLLMADERTAPQLSEALSLKTAEVVEHLAMLRENGLVTARNRDNATHYSFDKKALYTLNRDVMRENPVPTPVDDYPDEEARKMLKNWFVGERCIIPEGNKRLEVLLKWLVTRFEVGREYTEKEVNAIIKQHNDDTATLRRALIDFCFMQRDHGIYWRV